MERGAWWFVSVVAAFMAGAGVGLLVSVVPDYRAQVQVAAEVLGVAAAFGGVSVALSWRRKFFAQKKAEVLEKCFMTMKHFLEALNHLTNPFMFVKSPEDKREWPDEYARRHEEVSDARLKMVEVLDLAGLYLDDDERALLDRMWGVYREIGHANIKWRMYLGDKEGLGDLEEFTDAHKMAFGTDVMKKLAELESELEEDWKPDLRTVV